MFHPVRLPRLVFRRLQTVRTVFIMAPDRKQANLGSVDKGIHGRAVM
ncbi:hypothetical protein [Parvibaculum sp.]